MIQVYVWVIVPWCIWSSSCCSEASVAGRGPWWWVEEEDWLMAQVFHTHFTRAEARYRVCVGEITTVKQGYKEPITMNSCLQKSHLISWPIHCERWAPGQTQVSGDAVRVEAPGSLSVGSRCRTLVYCSASAEIHNIIHSNQNVKGECWKLEC